MAVGDTFGPELRQLRDPQTGVALLQLTDNQAHNRHLYFYVPTFTADGQSLLYISGRTGSQQFYKMDLQTGRSIQLTDQPDIFAGGSWYLEATRSIYFWSGPAICRTHIDSLQTDTLHRECVQGSYLSVSCDGRYVAYALPADRAPGSASTVREAAAVSTMTVLDTASRRSRALAGYPFAISHICFSPIDPTWMTFCWEGSWQRVPQRIWWIDVTGQRGGPLGPQPPNQARGHEFFLHDGSRVCFHGGQRDAEGNEVGWFFGHMATDGSDVRLFWTEGPTGHCQAWRSSDGSLKVICDVGGERGAQTDGWIALIDCDQRSGKGQFQRLHSHGASWVTQGAHPHPQFRPGGTQVVFTTDRKGPKAGRNPQGRSNIYLIDLP